MQQLPFAPTPRDEEDLDPTLSVVELARRAGNAVRRAFPERAWVRGEVQNLRVRNGHRWFELVEHAERGQRPAAAVQAVIWSSTWQRMAAGLRRHPGFELRDGIELRVGAQVDLRAERGTLQLVVGAIDPAHTLGALAGRRDEVLRLLAAEGLLQANGSRPWPALALHVGLVTSVGSAACEDFLHELAASGLGFRVSLVDVAVQGPAAERAIVRGLQRLAAGVVAAAGGPSTRPDVVALVRGGGSRADLAAFDSEAVARAVAGCPVPVVTGIGHEIDQAVADLVATRACKTPTACAAALVEGARLALAGVDDRAGRVAGAARRRVDREHARVVDGAERGRRSADAGLALAASRLEAAHVRLRREAVRAPERARDGVSARAGALRADTRRRTTGASADLAGRVGRLAVAGPVALARAGASLDRAAAAVAAAPERALPAAGRGLDAAEARVRGLDPRAVLARGYSVTRTAGGVLVRDPAAVAPGDLLVTELAGGRLASRVADPTVDPTGR